MAEEKKEETKRMGWLKGLIGTAMGLLSGATAMYLSPLLDTIIKPHKPLANFAVETDGLTATFHNRYAGEGWWDFGDGSPLEPAPAQQASITHVYPKAGNYPVKLMVRNFVGDENDRSVSLEVALAGSMAPEPAITDLEVFPIGADRSAPATFRVLAQTANTERLIWDWGSEHQPLVSTEMTAKQERFLTFATPGDHWIQLTALSGGQAFKRTSLVHVDPPKPGMLVARLHVTDRGNRIASHAVTEHVSITLPNTSTRTFSFKKTIVAKMGHTITDAKAGEVDPAFQNLKVTLAADKRSIEITGDLTPTKEMLQAQSPPMFPLLITHTRHSAMAGPATEITSAISLPGKVILPMPVMPTDATDHQRFAVLEILGADGFVWRQAVPTHSGLDFQGHHFTVNAVPAGNDIKIEIVQGNIGLTSFSK